MTQQQQSQAVPYTPTPWVRSQLAHLYIIPKGDPHPVCALGEYEKDGSVYMEFKNAEGNGRLITAAVNSYARHFGPNAVQAAEDDLLGRALEMLQSLVSAVHDYRLVHDSQGPGHIETGRSWDRMRRVENEARAILAQAEGGA